MMMVQIHPPMNPSTVFFGDSRMSGVLPHIIPQMYAKMSFVMTRHTGKKNHINPSKIELTIKCAWNTTSNSVICVQQNWVNWYAYDPGVNVMTKNTKPISLKVGNREQTHKVQYRGNEAMMNRKVKEILVYKDNVLEIVNQALPIQKEHCSRQKVPKHH